MRFLLDENVSPVIGHRLESLGHDVLLASFACRGAADDVVVALAVREQRVLVTEDKDFGELAFRKGLWPSALIRLLLLKFTPGQKADRLAEVILLIPNIVGGTLVIEAQRTRFRAWPDLS